MNKDLVDMMREVHKLGVEVTPVGSRVSCNPPPTDTDEDFLILCKDKKQLANLVSIIVGEMEQEGNKHYDGASARGFTSWRKDDLNLIVTRNKSFAKKFKTATKIATKLNLMQKSDRVMLFQGVLYGKFK